MNYIHIDITLHNQTQLANLSNINIVPNMCLQLLSITLLMIVHYIINNYSHTINQSNNGNYYIKSSYTEYNTIILFTSCLKQLLYYVSLIYIN